MEYSDTYKQLKLFEEELNKKDTFLKTITSKKGYKRYNGSSIVRRVRF